MRSNPKLEGCLGAKGARRGWGGAMEKDAMSQMETTAYEKVYLRM